MSLSFSQYCTHLIHTYVQTHAYTPRTDVCAKTQTHMWLLFNRTSTVKTLGLGKYGKQPAEKYLSCNFLILNYIQLTMITKAVFAETRQVQVFDIQCLHFGTNGIHFYM